MSRKADLSRLSSAELYHRALVALRLASNRGGEFDPNATVGSLRHIADALDAALRLTGEGLVARGCAARLAAVDGPFTGDVRAATGTAAFWLERSGAILALGVIPAIDNAHIAAGGLVCTTGEEVR